MSCSLRSLISPFLSETPSTSDSVDHLLAHFRVITAVYLLVTTRGYDHESGSCREWMQRLSGLFYILYRKGRRTNSFIERAQLLSAMYRLTGETDLAYEQEYTDSCRTVGEQLFADYEQLFADYKQQSMNNGEQRYTDNTLSQAAYCRCITDYYYPEAAVGDTAFDRYQTILNEWVSSLSETGNWEGISDDTALARIEVLNRNSYMFLNRTFDGQIAEAYRYYLSRILACPTNNPHTLGALYEVVMQGNAYPIDQTLAGSIADELCHRFQDTSYHISHLCGQEMFNVSFISSQDYLLSK
jgi:hypothetical protein